jgi:hypothetical protein
MIHEEVMMLQGWVQNLPLDVVCFVPWLLAALFIYIYIFIIYIIYIFISPGCGAFCALVVGSFIYIYLYIYLYIFIYTTTTSAAGHIIDAAVAGCGVYAVLRPCIRTRYLPSITRVN